MFLSWSLSNRGGIPQDHTEATAVHMPGQVGPIHTQAVEPVQEEG